jgi:hypothetical protein
LALDERGANSIAGAGKDSTVVNGAFADVLAALRRAAAGRG